MAKDLLSGKKIAEQLGLPAGAVTKWLKENKVTPDEKKGVCNYYGPKTVKAVDKALFLTAGKVAAALGEKPAAVSKAIKAAGIEADKTAGACKYYGPKTQTAIKKALK